MCYKLNINVHKDLYLTLNDQVYYIYNALQVVARQPSINGQLYSPKSISKIKKKYNQTKKCPNMFGYHYARPSFLCARFVYAANRGQGQSWTYFSNFGRIICKPNMMKHIPKRD